jgi:hypothetical protein
MSVLHKTMKSSKLVVGTVVSRVPEIQEFIQHKEH